MKRSGVLLAVLGFLFGGSESAKAGYTVKFDSLTSPGFVDFMPSYSEGGFNFTSNTGYPPAFGSWGTWSLGYTGSAALFNNAIGGTTTLSKSGGGEFALTSIDLSELFPFNGVNNSVTFIGTKADSSTVTQSFTLDEQFGNQTFIFSGFSGLTSVSWTQDFAFHQFDNVVIDGVNFDQVVPTPAPPGLILAATAVPFAGFFGWRRRNRSAAG